MRPLPREPDSTFAHAASVAMQEKALAVWMLDRFQKQAQPVPYHRASSTATPLPAKQHPTWQPSQPDAAGSQQLRFAAMQSLPIRASR